MRILTVPKNLDVGGSQLNSVNVAVALAGRGHQVLVASSRGPATESLHVDGVEIAEIPSPEDRVARLRALTKLKRSHGPDVIHAYEVRAIMEACLVSLRKPSVPILGTIMSTRVPWYLPESLPLTVGMPNLASFTRRWRTGSTTLIESPVREPGPGKRDVETPRRSGHCIVLVSRLVEPFKREGILRAIAAMDTLGGKGLVLEIVGDGPARPLFEGAAESVNQKTPAPVIEFLGEQLDPYASIASANVVVGNGLSVIEGSMMGKPAVVVGREGYSAVVDSLSLPELIDRGFYGVGNGLNSKDPLPDQIMAAMSATREAELTALASQMRDRYGLEAIVERFEEELDQARYRQPPRAHEMARSLARSVHYRARRRLLGRKAHRLGLTAENNDDFVFGRLRNMALPGGSRGTGRNLRS